MISVQLQEGMREKRGGSGGIKIGVRGKRPTRLPTPSRKYIHLGTVHLIFWGGAWDLCLGRKIFFGQYRSKVIFFAGPSGRIIFFMTESYKYRGFQTTSCLIVVFATTICLIQAFTTHSGLIHAFATNSNSI